MHVESLGKNLFVSRQVPGSITQSNISKVITPSIQIPSRTNFQACQLLGLQTTSATIPRSQLPQY